MTILSPAVKARIAQFADLINAGIRSADAREQLGITKGQAAHTMRQAKALGLVENVDHNWLRKLNARSAALIRDDIAEQVAEGASLSEAAVNLGLTFNAVERHWTLIRAGLGWQAS